MVWTGLIWLRVGTNGDPVNAVMNLRVLQNDGKLSRGYITGVISSGSHLSRVSQSVNKISRVNFIMWIISPVHTLRRIFLNVNSNIPSAIFGFHKQCIPSRVSDSNCALTFHLLAFTRLCYLEDSFHPEDGGDTFLRNVCSITVPYATGKIFFISKL
jgi:hypothetical protein